MSENPIDPNADTVFANRITCTRDGKNLGFMVRRENGSQLIVMAEVDAVIDAVAKLQNVRMGGAL